MVSGSKDCLKWIFLSSTGQSGGSDVYGPQIQASLAENEATQDAVTMETEQQPSAGERIISIFLPPKIGVNILNERQYNIDIYSPYTHISEGYIM